MKESIQKRIERLVERYEEISRLLSDPEIIENQTKFRLLSKEYSDLTGLVEHYTLYKANLHSIEELKNMQSDDDFELRTLASEELKKAELKSEELESNIYTFLLPSDPNDGRNIFLEIRAGTGGNEAALFSGDLFRMYLKFAESQYWRVELINESFGEQGGYKEVIVRIIGDRVYSKLKFESGAHRVQRVPLTESQGRIHTSACTVAILPEVETVDFIEIDPSQLRVDTYRASGAGGQHVNRTDSAVRITHLPTGIVVECQDERSQHKNRAKALSVLQAKILAAEQEKQQKEQAATRKSLVGSGDRSERIRTYNFPQGRVTDHRINLTLYRLEEVLEGKLLLLLEPLMHEYQAEQLAQINN